MKILIALLGLVILGAVVQEMANENNIIRFAELLQALLAAK